MTTDNCHTFPRWMTLNQAVNYCPYGKKHLVELIRAGMVKGGQLLDKGTRDWFVDKASLDRYMTSLCLRAESEKEIIANFRRLL